MGLQQSSLWLSPLVTRCAQPGQRCSGKGWPDRDAKVLGDWPPAGGTWGSCMAQLLWPWVSGLQSLPAGSGARVMAGQGCPSFWPSDPPSGAPGSPPPHWAVGGPSYCSTPSGMLFFRALNCGRDDCPVLQMRRLGPREGKPRTCVHMAGKWGRWD